MLIPINLLFLQDVLSNESRDCLKDNQKNTTTNTITVNKPLYLTSPFLLYIIVNKQTNKTYPGPNLKTLGKKPLYKDATLNTKKVS
jgi:hypothetical protein